MNNDILFVKCDACGENAHEPYIECTECNANLCTGCFATGCEVRDHRNSHNYAVRRNDFPLFDNCNWSAKEECKLLTALSTYGYGNWEEIAKSVHTRSQLECQEHYRKYYIEHVQYTELKLIPETEQSLFPKPIVPYLFNLECTLNPPRNNSGDKQLAGYNAYRSEFELSYDHNAENIFNIEDGYTDDKEDECMDHLKVSLVNALNTRLNERKRRYKILQNHGLIMPNKLVSWLRKFEGRFLIEKPERLLPFLQFMTGMQFDAFMESLGLQEELIQRLLSLHEYRRKGIKTLHTARLYKHLKREHELMLKEQKYATSIMMKKFDSQSAIIATHKFPKEGEYKNIRKKVILDISDLPGYHLLSDGEKTLCSHLRLLPKNYMSIKDVLIAENNKMGYLRLLDARRLLKIDVNKTRKIYDYLISEGFILHMK